MRFLVCTAPSRSVWQGLRFRCWRRAHPFLRTMVTGVVVSGCASTGADAPTTPMQTDRYIRKAIRSSSEGIILLPSRLASQIYELPRLNEIAQDLRQPAAACFLERAIATMVEDDSADEGYKGVPDGQAKIRTRLSPDGSVLRTEILESGFLDEAVPKCVAKAIEGKRWPTNRAGTTHYVDVVYWVSLGAVGGLGAPEVRAKVRRAGVEAAVRAKPCLRGRASPSRYDVDALNLVGAEGATLINRVDNAQLSDPVRQCISQAFRGLRLPRDQDSFVRPVAFRTALTVTPAGDVVADDESWLRVIRLEERAKRAELRARASGVDEERARASSDDANPAEVGGVGADTSESDDVEAMRDPGQGGIRLDLRGRPRH